MASPATTNAVRDSAEEIVRLAATLRDNPLAAAEDSLTWLQKHQAQLIDSVIVLVLGVIAAIWIGRAARRAMERKNLDAPMTRLLVRGVRCLVFGPALYMVLDTWDFKLTGILAGLGVVGVGVGFGMQGLSSNMVAGLTIIFTRPFRVGEYIEILGVAGTVANIDLLSTTLVHSDLSKIFIPNHKITGEVLHNFGFIRQAELTITVPYQTNLQQAQTLIAKALEGNKRVLRQPGPVISVAALQDFGVLIKVNPWLKLEDFGAAPSELYETIIQAFRENKIEIPRPRHELHVVPAAAASPVR